MSQNRNQQPTPSQPQQAPKPKTPVVSLAPVVNIYRWRNKRFAGQTVTFGQHVVAFDDKGWAPSDLPREVDSVLNKMPADEAARKGYEKLVLNEDLAWSEDISQAEDDIRRSEQEVERAKGMLASAHMALTRSRARLEEIKSERLRYKAEVARVEAEIESQAKAAVGAE